MCGRYYISTHVPNFGFRYGFKCRFLGAHVRTDETGNISLVGDADKKARAALTADELNFVSNDVRNLLRTKKVRLWESALLLTLLRSVAVSYSCGYCLP